MKEISAVIEDAVGAVEDDSGKALLEMKEEQISSLKSQVQEICLLNSLYIIALVLSWPAWEPLEQQEHLRGTDAGRWQTLQPFANDQGS